ncbi:Hypothetical protein BFG00_0482 [Corynebacterium pseudotuberculosis]|nr:Hypothetical protein BFF96_0483 [Corynebacterium pseudotuberculosis]AUY59870.1 Hypothetical protein BFG00_0482 [Corynebacterium pseudotuberculosis]VTQ70667.1 Uncharacterised protein [Corynebacterium pseudotuberculosis]
MKILKVYVVISGTVAEVGKNVQLCLLIGCIFMEQRFYYFGFLCGEILRYSVVFFLLRITSLNLSTLYLNKFIWVELKGGWERIDDSFPPPFVGCLAAMPYSRTLLLRGSLDGVAFCRRNAIGAQVLCDRLLIEYFVWWRHSVL